MQNSQSKSFYLIRHLLLFNLLGLLKDFLFYSLIMFNKLSNVRFIILILRLWYQLIIANHHLFFNLLINHLHQFNVNFIYIKLLLLWFLFLFIFDIIYNQVTSEYSHISSFCINTYLLRYQKVYDNSNLWVVMDFLKI